MKTLAKLSLAAALVATLGTSAAFADSPQMRSQLDIQRAHDARNQRITTVGVYAGDRGVGRDDRRTDERRSDARFELRTNARGQQFGLYAPVK